MFTRISKARPKLMVDKDGNLKTGKEFEVITKQSSAKRCNLEKIVEKYRRTGSLPKLYGKPVFYGDFTGNTDLGPLLDQVHSAEASFKALPADIRSKFDNKPAKLMEFCSKKENLVEARKLGLAKLVQETDTHNHFGELKPEKKVQE